MANDSDILRQLHKIQMGVPDKEFFAHQQAEIKADQKKRKKTRTGFFHGSPFARGRKTGKIDIEIAREKIKSFNNSFMAIKRKQMPEEAAAPGLMSIQEMNEFRNAIKESAETEEGSYGFRALEGIVKYIDLKNSGVVSSKQDILFDSLKKLALVLMENGGLSMFHATWFYTIYMEYIGHYKMFRKGDMNKAAAGGSKEVKEISRKLAQKQFEIPQYLHLANEEKRDIRQLTRYSKDPYVKRSIHGQKGCTLEHIKKIFIEKSQGAQSKAAEQNYLNEVNIILSYALFFSRIPMMHPLVEAIAQAIPNLNTETTLYREKIMISLNLIQLDLMRGIGMHDGSDQSVRKIIDVAYSAFKRCTSLITDNRLKESSIKDDIYTFPFLKQANILVTYKELFYRNKGAFLKMIENSLQHLSSLKETAKANERVLAKTYELVDLYERNLQSLSEQIKADISADAPPTAKKSST